jgi:carnitine O-acetyltransferase
MMGLKVMLRGDETHQIFEDEMYSKSQEWKLSTSGLSAGSHLTGTGFGAAWPDGYGVNCESYWGPPSAGSLDMPGEGNGPSEKQLLISDLAGSHLLKFGIESKWSCEVTSTARFKHNLAQSLRDMRRVVEAQQGAGEIKAKL